jgi:hypothetical protein
MAVSRVAARRAGGLRLSNYSLRYPMPYVPAGVHLSKFPSGGTEAGVDHRRLSAMLALPQEVSRMYRDDITGKFHDQGDAKWIVIRGQLRGHKL